MSNLKFRRAKISDVHFIVETIIEADKSNSSISSLCTTHNLTLKQIEHFLLLILQEDIDGCDLSLSSFLIAEYNNEYAGAICGWIEKLDGHSSAFLKANLLKFHFPIESIIFRNNLKTLLNSLSPKAVNGSIQIGWLYIKLKYRNLGLGKSLMREMLLRIAKNKLTSNEVYLTVFETNITAITFYKRLGFKINNHYSSNDEDVLKFLPSNKILELKKSY